MRAYQRFARLLLRGLMRELRRSAICAYGRQFISSRTASKQFQFHNVTKQLLNKFGDEIAHTICVLYIACTCEYT
jgi:hypothetical protein